MNGKNIPSRNLRLVFQGHHGLSIAAKSSHTLKPDFFDGNHQHRAVAVDSVAIFSEVPRAAMTDLFYQTMVHRSGRCQA